MRAPSHANYPDDDADIDPRIGGRRRRRPHPIGSAVPSGQADGAGKTEWAVRAVQ